MLRKTLLFILLISLLFVSGCRDRQEELIERPDLQGLEFAGEADSFDIHIVYFRSINMEYINEQLQQFNELFDKELTITPHQVLDLSGQKIVGILEETGAEGFYQFPLSNVERLAELKDSNRILAIDELLEGNQLWNEMPSELRNIYKLDDGHVWALPRSFEPVVYGRMMRSDYLKTLGLEVPGDLDSLYEVTLALSQGDPDGNNLNDTVGMTYFNSMNFRDIFSAFGTPITLGSDGYQRTSIVYNPWTESFEDSMLLPEMKEAFEYIVRLRQEGLVQKEGWRFNSWSSITGNPEIASLYDIVTNAAFQSENVLVIEGITGKATQNLNPISYDFTAGMYVLGADTENPSATMQTFLNLFLGDLEGFLFASRGAPGGTYELNGNEVIITDYRFFSARGDAIIENSPFFRYETMNLTDNTELADGTVIGRLLESIQAKEEYISRSKQLGYMYELSMDKAYPELFKVKEGELLNSSSAALFEKNFSRMLTGHSSIQDGIDAYIRGMKILGMQEIIDELNERMGSRTQNSY